MRSRSPAARRTANSSSSSNNSPLMTSSSTLMTSSEPWVPAAPLFVYASEEGLQNLKHYKYTGVDLSLLAPVLYQPWWNYAVTKLPLSMAPNLVTLCGLAILLASFCLEWVYCPTLGQECGATTPRWLFFFHSFAVFAYQTLDAIDGKQARRTGSSSALGELFDHGCDAISTVTITLTTAGVLQLGGSWWTFWLLLLSCVAFFMAAYEHFHTGTLVLGYVNVTEVHFLLTTMYFLTGVFGPSMWLQEISVPSPLQPLTEAVGFSGGTAPLWFPVYVFSMVGAVVTIANNFTKILPQASVAGESLLEKVVGLGSVLTTAAAAYIWAADSPNNVLQKQPILFLLPIGLTFAYQVGQLVVARVCMQHATRVQPMLAWPVLGALQAGLFRYFKLHVFDEEIFLHLFVLVSIIAYAHFANRIIIVFCKHLNIRAFHIVPKTM